MGIIEKLSNRFLRITKKDRYSPPEIEYVISECDPLITMVVLLNKRQVGRLKSIYKKDENSIFIGDIEVNYRYQGKGIGTFMLNKLVEYAKNRHIDQIIGNLAEVDREHHAVLVRFYEKSGFIVQIYDSTAAGAFYGTITKTIMWEEKSNE